MHITFLVNRDIEANIALNLLLPALAGQHRFSILLSERVGGRNSDAARMLGQLAFIEQDLFNLWVLPEADQAERTGSWLGFEGLSRRWNAPLQTLTDVHGEAALDTLKRHQPDLFVSIRFGHILREQAIAIPRLGVLNLHSGLLPQYRGVLATLRALLHDDRQIGCTLHWIDTAAIDQGPVIAEARINVERERSLFWHILQLYPPGVAMISRAIECLSAGNPLPVRAPAAEQDAYYSFPDDADLAQFTAQGWRLFDREDISEIAQRYRAPAHASAPAASR